MGSFSDGVDGDVNAALGGESADFAGPILALCVEDGFIDSEFPCFVEFRCAATGCNDAAAEEFCDHECGEGDASADPGDEDRSAGLEFGAGDKAGPRSEE